MSKGIIKEKKPQKLSRWEVIKAWIAESIASIKRSLKDGGWKGTMLALSGTVATFGTVLAACVTEPDVKIETITDKEKVESLVSENFSVENAVKDEMQKQFGKLENFTFENGVAKAVVTKDGEKYNAEVAINVDANDFKVEKYTNAKVADDGSLHFYLDGKLTSEEVDGIVVEVGKDIYGIDPTDFYIEISMAVSDASLKKVETEKPDPENPGGEDKPDPDEPENPGGEEKPDPDKPGGEENPDPDKPENPGGEENPDPDEPENPGGEEKPDPDKPGGEENPDPDEPDKPGGEEKPDPDKPGEGGEENPDPEEPTEITFDSWEELMNIEDVNFKNELDQILQKNLFTDLTFRRLFGADLTLDNLDDGTINILKWGFDLNESKKSINAIEILGVRNGYPYEDSKAVKSAKFTLAEPLSFDSIKVIKEGNKYNYNFDSFEQGLLNAVYKKGAEHSVNHESLDDTNQQYFDLCMPLAVEKGYINQDAELAFVTVDARGSTNEQFGSTYRIKIVATNLKSNSKEEFTFTFKDSVDSSKTPLERIREAYNKGDYLVGTSGDTPILSSSDIVLEFDTLNNVVTYTIPQKEGENQA